MKDRRGVLVAQLDELACVGIDVGTVWQTATSDVPPLKPLLAALLTRQGSLT